jgi:hypothetical protein
MRYRLLVASSLAWAALVVVGFTALAGSPSLAVFVRTQLELAKLLAFLGPLAAALSFDRGEYLRRGWLLVAACMGLLLLRDLTLVPVLASALAPSEMTLVRGLTVVLANAAQIWGTWILARAWKVASLELPASRAAQRAVVGAVVMLVLAVTAPGLWQNAVRVHTGEYEALAGLGSAAGDAIALCLIAPLLLTALALRGGVFGWPFSLLTASYVAWLFYDAAQALGPAAGLDPTTTRILSEACRALGCLLGFSAGMAQRFVISGVRGAVRRAA